MKPIAHEPAWLHGHPHEPNPQPPTSDANFVLQVPQGISLTVDLSMLQALPCTTVPNCLIVSTGHGVSGPFAFDGVRLLDLLNQLLPANTPWQTVDVISTDGFGTRLTHHDLQETDARPILLAYLLDGEPLTRAQGLVRLIVPSETDDALRQVKWVTQINVRLAERAVNGFPE